MQYVQLPLCGSDPGRDANFLGGGGGSTPLCVGAWLLHHVDLTNTKDRRQHHISKCLDIITSVSHMLLYAVEQETLQGEIIYYQITCYQSYNAIFSLREYIYSKEKTIAD